MLLHHAEQAIAWNHLTESQLRQLHRRFGHPSGRRLATVLQRAGHEIELKAIQHLTKYCHQCQMHAKSPGRFKFILKEDYNFNFEIIIDIIYLEGRSVLHVVDESTSFQAARFLRDISVKTTWDTLRAYWINIYQGLSDYIIHDAGKNFSSQEFQSYTKAMTIEIKEVLVKAYNSVGKVERYYAPLRRVYEIIRDEVRDR